MANSTTKVASGGGVSIVVLLGLLFIGLKLGGVITWSWVWVLAPFWIPFSLLLAFLFIAGIVLLVASRSKRW